MKLLRRRRLAPVNRPGVIVTFDVAGRPCRWPFGVGHLLIAGSTGSGKSVALRHTLAGLAADPTVVICAIDLKVVELSPWRPRMAMLATTRPDAVQLLGLVRSELDRRTTHLTRLGLDAWSPEHGPWLLVVVDELAELLEAATKADKAEADQAQDLLVSIGRLGRALGIHLVGATQRPDADVLSGALRGQFDWRLGLRMRDPAESRMVCPAAVADLTILDGGGWSMWLPPLPNRVELARAPLIPLADVPAIAAAVLGPRLPLFPTTAAPTGGPR